MREELRHKRGYRHQMFSDNGKQIFRAYAGDKFYNNKLGVGDGEKGFREIDIALHWDETSRSWGFEYHSYQPFIPEFADEWFSYRDLYKDKDQRIEFRPIAAHVAGQFVERIEGLTENNAIVYEDAFGEGKDLIIYFTKRKFVKAVRIREGYKGTADQTFDFEFRFPDQSSIIRSESISDPQSDEGAYELRLDESKEFDTNKETLVTTEKGSTILSPFRVWDSGTIDGELRGQIVEQTPAELIVQNGRTYIRKIVTADLLARSRGDVFTDTVITYSEDKDTYYGTSFTTGGAPNSDQLNIGGWGDFYYSYLEFDLSAIMGSTITYAGLGLKVKGVAVNPSTTSIQRITASWTEAGVTSASNPAATSTGQVALDNPVTVGAGNVDEKDVTTMVQSWLDGTNSNFGFKLNSTTNNNAAHSYHSSDAASSADEPYLELDGTFITETLIQKSLEYRIVGQPDDFDVYLRDTSADFDIRFFDTEEFAITKSLRYAVAPEHSITKSLRYAVIKEIAITKSLTYVVEVPYDKTETLTEDFNDNSLDAVKWFDWGGAGSVETNGQLELTNGINDTSYHGIDTNDFYDLSDSYVHVELKDAGNQSLASLEVMLQIFPDTNNNLFMLVSNGVLRAYRKVAGVNSQRASITYNASTMRWLRIRESAGTTYWEYAASSSGSWTTLHSEATPIDVTEVKVGLLCGTWSNEASSTKIIFDNLNTAGTTEELIQKSLTYRVIREIGITKSLKYSVLDPNAIQKSLKYTVVRTPSAITKSLRYAVAKETPITKSLTYKVTADHGITKSLKYSVLTEGLIQKSLEYVVAQEISITKQLRYVVVAPKGIQKSLRYVIENTPSAITRSLRYLVTAEKVLTKQLKYVVTVDNAITKSLRYAISIAHKLTKSLRYAVLTENNIQKSLKYVVTVDQAVTKPLRYAIVKENAITKSLSYVVTAGTTIIKSLKYAVLTAQQVSKQLRYAILTENTVSKSLKYTVVTDSKITKALRYVLLTDEAITKVLKYAVLTSTVLVKSLKYTVEPPPVRITKPLQYAVKQSPSPVTKTLRYEVLTIQGIAKTLKYTVITPQEVELSLKYAVLTEHLLSKSLSYEVVAPKAITKSLTYVIFHDPYEVVDQYEADLSNGYVQSDQYFPSEDWYSKRKDYTPV